VLHLCYLCAIFLCFEVVSGLGFNLAKSELVPMAMGEVNNVDGLAGCPGCRASSLPLKDLGFPLRASFKAKFIWDGFIEKIEHRLAG
jgi:hypothetical protein